MTIRICANREHGIEQLRLQCRPGAPDGAAALVLLQDNDPIDLLFTGIVISGIDGIKLARRTREQNPCLKVLFASGGFGEDHLKPTDQLLRMPFSPGQLTAAIAEALDTK
jgi:CheY-like chemotaxis protein